MKFKIEFLLLVLITLVISCSEENNIQPEVPTNELIKANFITTQSFHDISGDNDIFTWLENDTICFERNVTFKATGSYDNKYEWYLDGDTTKMLGKEKNYHPQKEGEYKLKLIVKANPNKPLYKNDDGIDSAFRNFYVIAANKLSIWGEYIGYDTAKPNVQFKIKISYDDGLNLFNIDNGLYFPGSTSSFPGRHDISNHLVAFDYNEIGTLNLIKPRGYIKLDKECKNLVVEFKYEENSIRKKYKFIGTKL